jgi:hypothetical protein
VDQCALRTIDAGHVVPTPLPITPTNIANLSDARDTMNDVLIPKSGRQKIEPQFEQDDPITAGWMTLR